MLLFLIGCTSTITAVQSDLPPITIAPPPASPTPITQHPTPITQHPTPIIQLPTPITQLPTPIPIQNPSQPCGQLLPVILPSAAQENRFDWSIPPISGEVVPQTIRPALERLFAHPEDVSLVVYRLGYEGIGFYHNENQPMPLASVSKLIELVAYDQAVTAGTIDSTLPVSLADIEQFYLPRTDLGAHNRALRQLDAQTLTQDDAVQMMMRYSANSASDYIHHLLGQTVIEQTILDLNLGPHTAPCLFLGRFIGMANLSSSEMAALNQNSAEYGASVTYWADLYRENEQFKLAAQGAWSRGRQPNLQNQALFVDTFETRGTAAGYASLMARIASGQIGSPALQQQLEWPLEAFESNQIHYQRIGYKNGNMPGVLTTAYYSQPYWSDQPIVVVLFYKNLPLPVYREWRRTLTHDALAHWLMQNPQAIHILHVLRDAAE